MALSLIGFMLAAAGHGTYILLGIASAPLTLLRNFWLSLAGPPLLWAIIGGLLAYSSRRLHRRIVFIGLSFHYLGVALVSLIADFADREYIRRVWQLNSLMLVVGITLYVTGQISIWA